MDGKKFGDKRRRTAPHSWGEEILGQEEITFVEEKLLFNTRFLRFFSPIYVDKRQRQRAAPHSRGEEIWGQEEIAFVEKKLLSNIGFLRFFFPVDGPNVFPRGRTYGPNFFL